MITLEKAFSTRNRMLHSQAPFINNTENKKTLHNKASEKLRNDRLEYSCFNCPTEWALFKQCEGRLLSLPLWIVPYSVNSPHGITATTQGFNSLMNITGLAQSGA